MSKKNHINFGNLALEYPGQTKSQDVQLELIVTNPIKDDTSSVFARIKNHDHVYACVQKVFAYGNALKSQVRYISIECGISVPAHEQWRLRSADVAHYASEEFSLFAPAAAVIASLCVLVLCL